MQIIRDCWQQFIKPRETVADAFFTMANVLSRSCVLPPPSVRFVPLGVCAVSVGTIVLCHLLRLRAGHWLLPYISLYGVSYPSRSFYLFGFGGCSLVFFGMSLYWFRLAPLYVPIAPEAPYARFSDALVRWGVPLTGVVAGMGLAGQAVIPVQEDILDVFLGTASLSLVSLVHQMFAGSFFCAAMANVYFVVFLWRHVPFFKAFATLRAKIVLAVAATLLMVSLFFHPASGVMELLKSGRLLLDEGLVAFGVLTQWGFVAVMLAYFSLFYIDLRHFYFHMGLSKRIQANS